MKVVTVARSKVIFILASAVKMLFLCYEIVLLDIAVKVLKWMYWMYWI